jgi:nitrogen regulatory protein PII-like uncharacterized protein
MKKFVRFILRKAISKSGLYVLIVVILAGVAGYFYWQYREAQYLINNPTQASEQEVKELTEKVGKLMDLPQDEKPTVISVVDKEKIKDQPFFSNAENGDKVLVYTVAKKAILYRPLSGKIIEVGPVDIAPTTNYSVALYSATGSLNILEEIESKLKESVTNLEYPIKKEAESDTDTILVIDVKGDKSIETEQIAKLLGGEVSEIPQNENIPDSDFLIIVGRSL